MPTAPQLLLLLLHASGVTSIQTSLRASMLTDVAIPFTLLPRLGGKHGKTWLLAVQEAGLDPEHVSDFGMWIPKYTHEEVKQIMALSHEKKRTFSFAGSVFRDTRMGTHKGRRIDMPSDTEFKSRQWMLDFAGKHFGPDDFLFITDAELNETYTPLGAFDHSCEGSAGNASGSDDYMQHMAESNFTLCPGGDTPWSMRAYEAIAAGSVPLISSPSRDWRPAYRGDALGRALQAVFNQYKYATTAQVVKNGYHLDDLLIQRNLETFVKYQTFIHGDLTPPGFHSGPGWKPGHVLR